MKKQISVTLSQEVLDMIEKKASQSGLGVSTIINLMMKGSLELDKKSNEEILQELKEMYAFFIKEKDVSGKMTMKDMKDKLKVIEPHGSTK